MLRKFFGRLFQLLEVVGVPGDLRIWWNILTPVVPTALTGLWAYGQQASVPVLLVLLKKVREAARRGWIWGRNELVRLG